jgi:hypothetical protein
MKTALMIASFGLLVVAPVKALAASEYDEITGVRLFLSTSSFELMDHYTSSETLEGYDEPTERLAERKAYPSTVVDGYVRRGSFDPGVITSTATHADLVAGTRGTYGFEFLEDSEITETRYPRKALVSRRLNNLYLPIAMVTRMERRTARFDGGEPFFMDPAEAALLRDKPFSSCRARYDPDGKSYWVSYNKKVGKSDLEQICKLQDRGGVEKIDRRSWGPNVFVVNF